MDEQRIEKIIESVSASFAIEDMPLTEQNKNDIRRVLGGEATNKQIMDEIDARYGIRKG